MYMSTEAKLNYRIITSIYILKSTIKDKEHRHCNASLLLAPSYTYFMSQQIFSFQCVTFNFTFDNIHMDSNKVCRAQQEIVIVIFILESI
jgi:hypothetical protein